MNKKNIIDTNQKNSKINKILFKIFFLKSKIFDFEDKYIFKKNEGK